MNFSLLPPWKNKDLGPGFRVNFSLLGTLVILAKQGLLFPSAVNTSQPGSKVTEQVHNFRSEFKEALRSWAVVQGWGHQWSDLQVIPM